MLNGLKALAGRGVERVLSSAHTHEARRRGRTRPDLPARSASREEDLDSIRLALKGDPVVVRGT
ncbi:MAG: hypothetical protein HC779_07205 [Phyllobacteriaceae bacterium]|nr:hypothetical protein [Phyllobacteriaceae bacterium]